MFYVDSNFANLQYSVRVRAFLVGCGAVCEHKPVHRDAYHCISTPKCVS